MKLSLAATLSSLLFSACAHLPTDDEKSAFRSQQQEIKKIETALYSNGDTNSGLFDQLKVCSLQLHDRVNPEEGFEWYETVDKHSDKDIFADPDRKITRAEYDMLVEKYKIFKQYSAAKKDLYEHRLKTCQKDLKSAMRHEKLRNDQAQALLDKLSAAEGARAPASVAAPVPAPAAVEELKKEEVAPTAPPAPPGKDTKDLESEL